MKRKDVFIEAQFSSSFSEQNTALSITYPNDCCALDDIDIDLMFSVSIHNQDDIELVASQSNHLNVFVIKMMAFGRVYNHHIQMDLVDTKMLPFHLAFFDCMKYDVIEDKKLVV